MQADEKAISLAGSVLSRGNPFEEGSTARTKLNNLFPPDHRDFLFAQLETFMEPYFTASLSLAGHILNDAPDMREAPAAVKAEPEHASLSLEAMGRPEAMVSLLKGMHPAGTTWAHLALAVGASVDEAKVAAASMRARGFVREDSDRVFASLEAMADESIDAQPWPEGTGI